ncbi:TPA: TetR/AcrR family transcriptional regulator [Klebsiella michiganensis]|nr:TetR/AcrR family transcriptional regulator [Klebsiella michiganensis]
MNANGEQKSAFTVQKNKITDAAGKCIISKGVNGSSIKDIQDASGMGAGQIYRHFSSKMKIVESVVEKNVTEQCDILPVIYSAAERNISGSLYDILDSKGVLRILKLNTILRVESMTHPELKKTYVRNYQLIEREHMRLLSQSFPKLTCSEKERIMSLVDMFLFTWGGMDSVMIRSEFYKENWVGNLWRKLIYGCNKQG